MAIQRFLPALRSAVNPDELYHVPSRLRPTRAENEILAQICDGTFRPPDAKEKSSIEEAYAVYVPFWRIDMQRSDQALRLGRLRINGVPLPTSETTEAKATWMVCARSAFPYTMKHPSTLLPGDAKPLLVSLAALEHGAPDTKGGWEIIDADVERSAAEKLAATALARSSNASTGFFSDSEVITRAAHFVLYPIWFARYRYRGAVTSDGDDLFYVGISAVDGMPITAEHPSKLKSGAARVKRFFFDD